MPLIDDILDNVGDCPYLSKLDLAKGFYQVPNQPNDYDKTAFCTPFGQYRFTRIPFGLMNAPATFQRMMLEVLEGQEDHSSAYIDDVLIYSKTWEEHLCHIRLVLESLRANGQTAKPSKCVWAANKVEYLVILLKSMHNQREPSGFLIGTIGDDHGLVQGSIIPPCNSNQSLLSLADAKLDITYMVVYIEADIHQYLSCALLLMYSQVCSSILR